MTGFEIKMNEFVILRLFWNSIHAITAIAEQTKPPQTNQHQQ